MPNIRLGNVVKKRLAKYDKDEQLHISSINIIVSAIIVASFVFGDPSYLWGLLLFLPFLLLFYATGTGDQMYRLFLNNLEHIPKNARKFTRRLVYLRYINSFLILLYAISFLAEGYSVYLIIALVFLFNMWFEAHSKKWRQKMIDAYINGTKN